MASRGESGGGGGGGVMNCEIGIDMYPLICMKWITNKNLLYKKINKIKFKEKKNFSNTVEQKICEKCTHKEGRPLCFACFSPSLKLALLSA